MWRYYVTQRPIVPGSIPKPMGNRIIEIKSLDKRQYIAIINGKTCCGCSYGYYAYGYVDYEKKLSNKDIKDYELAEYGWVNWEVEECSSN